MSLHALLRSQIARFIAVGVCAVGVDLVSYLILVAAGMEPAPAKALGFLAGAAISYTGGRYFVFRAEGGARGPFLFAALYAVSLAMNVAVNDSVLSVFGTALPALLAGWLTATLASASLNFIGQKFAVFTGERA